MAKTIRRKNFVADHVVRESIWIEGGWYAGYRYFHGAERRKAIRHWQSDRFDSYQMNPSKYFRKVHESRYQTHCKQELQKFVKCGDHEVQIIKRLPYDYWD